VTSSSTADYRRTERHSDNAAARHDIADAARASDTERAGLLISIQPRYAEAILSGQKKVELRRRPPKSHPRLAVIYGSGTDRSVLGAARIEAIHTSTPTDIWRTFGAVAGVTLDEFNAYFSGCAEASALELTFPERAPIPMPLKDLRDLGLEPPQSWRYISAEQLDAILGSIHPQGTTPRVSAAPRTRPLGWAWQGVKPLAAFGLRCVTVGFRQRARPSEPIALGPLDHTLPGPRCYSTPEPWRSQRGEDL
jgi:predicted transcriptional regulator